MDSARTTRSHSSSAFASGANGVPLSHKRVKEEETIVSLQGEPMFVDVKSDVKPVFDFDGEVANPPPSSVATEASLSKSPSPQAGPSKSPSPPMPKPSRKSTPTGPQLIGDLPIAREAALKTFNEIKFNNYQFKSLGRSKDSFEDSSCECVYEPDDITDRTNCGSRSDCINRLTQVECSPEDCRCRSHCQNQRFENRQYANIDIVQTELKGFGLRAEEYIPKETFIYEYVGDVVNPNTFKKRMRDYADEGIQHFYFMMLQKDEFIDATKSGGIGRFANHSCKPNCFVAKWTVGTHVRMGIFSKRDIQKHEELTFNYNVDRYGHEAQTCYCGEDNCVGFIGGKTQTDVATMDDLYLDALGITDEDDVAEVRGTKKKKGKKIDDEDFMPTVKAIVEKDVPKVIQAIRQTQNRKVLYKVLTRIKITEDQAVLRQLMRLRGFSVMKNVLDDWASDMELVELVLSSLETWPLLNRNKVFDSQINTTVESLKNAERESVRNLAEKLLTHWSSLKNYSRIPKRALPDEPTGPALAAADSVEDQIRKRRELEDAKFAALAMGRKSIIPRAPRDYQNKKPRRDFESWDSVALGSYPQLALVSLKPVDKPPPDASRQQQAIADVIAAATEKAAAEERALAEAAEAKKLKEEERAERHAKRKARAAAKKNISKEDKEALKEKRLAKLVGAVVVKCMSKYAKGLDRDAFKKYAKELTQIIVDKEKKSSSYKEGRLEALSDEKTAKIKKFSKEYIAKVMRKLEKANKHQSSSATPSSSRSVPMSAANTTSSSRYTDTPNSMDGDTSVGGITMSIEEAMDMEASDVEESDSELEDEVPETPVQANGHPDDRGRQDDPASLNQNGDSISSKGHNRTPSPPPLPPSLDQWGAGVDGMDCDLEMQSWS